MASRASGVSFALAVAAFLFLAGAFSVVLVALGMLGFLVLRVVAVAIALFWMASAD